MTNKKSGAKFPKNKKGTLANQGSGTKNWDDHHRIITAAYYRVKKYGFKGSKADSAQDWLKLEMESEARIH